MNFLRAPLLCYYCFLVLGWTNAQTGPHPANIKWQQINMPEVRVIFPQGFEQQGLRVANMIDYMERNNKRSIGEKSQKLELVLHNQTIVPNGFVGIAPFKSEFFATPPQSANILGTVDWLDGLTIHEYRHALQFSNAKVGLTKLLYFLQGDNGWGLAAGASIPNWFWEGDAVVAETALTNGGRGRAPFFSLEQRALLLNDRVYAYQKARNNSFKDLVPNHYRLGYIMSLYARKEFGNDILKTVFENGARYKPLFYSFSNALKNSIGLRTNELYRVAYRAAKEKWQAQISHLELSSIEPIKTKASKTVTSYRFPYQLKDSSIICLKNSFTKTDALVKIENGEEKVLCEVGFHIEKYLSFTGSKAVWTEYEKDPRRSKKNYSNIVYYDLQTQKKIRLTSNTRLFSPDFSHSGGRIIAVHITPEQQNSLVLFNAKTGAEINRIPNPENYFLAFPKWSEKDSDIVFIAKHRSRLAIFKFNFIERDFQQLTDWTHHTISDLFIQGDEVFFTSSFSGIDNIYKTDLGGSKRIEQLTSVRIGAFFPSVSIDGKSLIFSEFTDRGYQLSKLGLENNNARETGIKIVEPNQQNHYLINSLFEEGGNILDKIPNKNHDIKRYKGFFKSIKLHSWNLTPSVSLPTLDIQMDNMLEDFSMNIIGGYNFNEASPVYVAAVTYGKWYPLITGFAALSNRSAFYTTEKDSLAIQRFDQTSIGGGLTIPLSWNKGNYATSFRASANYIRRNINDAFFDEENIPNRAINTIQIGINWLNIKRTAYQNVGPRWGQGLTIGYNQAGKGNKEPKFNLGASLYLPGIGANDNLKLEAAYQRELLKNNYQFSDGFEYPRGYNAPLNDEFIRFSADYQFPLAYPDWGIWNITYFKRIRLDLFFDYGIGKIDFIHFREGNLVDRKDHYNSLGLEVIFDNHFWNELPVSFGLRNSFRLRDKAYDFEFFVNSFLLE